MSKGKLLAVCCVWLVILGMGVVAWKVLFAPQPPDQTSRYEHEITFALDSFSGYAVFRSEEFRRELAKRRIKLTLKDDGADYPQRAKELQTGRAQLAVFTVDGLVKACSELGELPAMIVAVVDETRGADAMVADKQQIPNLNALNDPRTQFVLTPGSPSETLTRVVMADFRLHRLQENPFVEAGDAEDVFRRYKRSARNSREVFVLWEPYVSKILENPRMHVVVDSSRFRGYIVDVIVASADFLAKGNDDLVADFVEAYLCALNKYGENMVQLVLDDAEAAGTPLTPEQANNLVEGIRWKNTRENYAHFGMGQGGPVQHIEDMIDNISGVLQQTGVISRDNPHLLHYSKILTRLKQRGFPNWEEEIPEDRVQLRPLSDREWAELRPIGTMEVPQLVFARGSSQLTEQSKAVLENLVQKLRNWPEYYLRIEGDASLRGDLEANKQLALQRAKAAEEHLAANGIGRKRVRAVGVEPSGSTSVSFVAGLPAQ